MQSEVQELTSKLRTSEEKIKLFESKDQAAKVSLTALPVSVLEPSVFRADVVMANLHNWRSGFRAKYDSVYARSFNASDISSYNVLIRNMARSKIESLELL